MSPSSRQHPCEIARFEALSVETVSLVTCLAPRAKRLPRRHSSAERSAVIPAAEFCSDGWLALSGLRAMLEPQILRRCVDKADVLGFFIFAGAFLVDRLRWYPGVFGSSWPRRRGFRTLPRVSTGGRVRWLPATMCCVLGPTDQAMCECLFVLLGNGYVTL